jgi:peptide/nickel transport system substrate-binding protein
MTMALILLLGGCGAKPADQGENSSKDSDAVTVMVSGKMNPEDASPVESSTEMCLYEMVYEPLVRYGKNGVIEPGLAESWKISDEGKDYTFTLRQGVKFSDGTDFNADSVVANAKRWNPDTFSAPLTNVEKLDEYTVKLSFQENCYPVLVELTYPRPYRMAAESAFDENGEFVKMVGTGEWMVESYVPEEEAVMVPNPLYYGEKPEMSKIIIRRVTDGQSRIMALQSGDADISLSDLPAESAAIIQSSDRLDVLSTEGTMGFFLMLNEENKLLQDQNVRLALNYAIDNKSIADNIFGSKAVAAKGILPQTVPYVTAENSTGYSYDPEKAKTILTKSGYTDGDGDGILEKDGKPLTLRLVFQSEEYASWKSICEYLQSEMKKVGIDVKLEQRDTAAYYDAIWKNRDFDMIIYRTYEDSWNPHGFLRSMFYRPEGSQAVCWYDPELNTDLEEVLKTQDEAGRQEKYDEIFKLLNDKALVVPLCYPNKQYAYNKRLQNLIVAPTTYEGIEWQKIKISE